MFTRILLSVDGTEPSRHASAHALDLARLSGAQVIALHVIEPPLPVLTPLEMGVMAMSALADPTPPPPPHADPAILEVREDAGRAGVELLGLQASNAYPATAIVETARQHGCDLIVMSSAGLGGLLALLRGSTAVEVFKGCDIPVLLVH